MNKKIKVLVVDDSALMRQFLSDIINADPRMTVTGTARNGKEALTQLSALKPDVITMDVEMPVMNGLEATRRIRALDNPGLASIPIIAMTANAFESDIKAALDAGMNAHVPKPFKREELIMKIAANLK